MKLSIIIPVYNELSTVLALLAQVTALDIDKEIIIVNDGSTDGTGEALAQHARSQQVVVHHSPVNLGKGASVRIGFSLAHGDIVTIQDADLELDPNDYHRLIVPIVEGQADVVFGSRFLGQGRRGTLSFFLANRGLAVLTNVLYGSHLTDIETCYKVFRADVVRALQLKASRFEIEPELTAQVLPRTRADGKKISWKDGVAAVYTLMAQRIKH